MFGIFKRVKRLEEIIKPHYAVRVDCFTPIGLVSDMPKDRISDIEERLDRISSAVRYNSEQFQKFAEQQGYKWEEKTEKKWVKKVKK